MNTSYQQFRINNWFQYTTTCYSSSFNGVVRVWIQPTDMCDTFDRLVDVRDENGAVVTNKRNTLCWQLQELLDDDDSYEDALILLHTVAATENPNTLEAARKAVAKLHELRTSERAEAQKQAKAMEDAKQRELASAQPDYSDEIAALLERRHADDAVFAEVVKGR